MNTTIAKDFSCSFVKVAPHPVKVALQLEDIICTTGLQWVIIPLYASFKVSYETKKLHKNIAQVPPMSHQFNVLAH